MANKRQCETEERETENCVYRKFLFHERQADAEPGATERAEHKTRAFFRFQSLPLTFCRHRK